MTFALGNFFAYSGVDSTTVSPMEIRLEMNLHLQPTTDHTLHSSRKSRK